MNKQGYYITPTELSSVVNRTVTGVLKSFKNKEEAIVNLNSRRVGIQQIAVKEYLKSFGFSYDKRIISHINLRGGISKTTASINLATRAYQYGFSTVLVDLDSQASATRNLGIDLTNNHPVFLDLWQDNTKINDSIIQIQENFSLIPSSLDNGLLDSSLSQKPALLKSAVKKLCDTLYSMGFDLIVIDCPPSLGAAVVSTICAADYIVIPVGSDPDSIHGLRLCVNEIQSISSTFGIQEPQFKILFSRYDGREQLSFKILSSLAQDPAYQDKLLPGFIRTSSSVPKASHSRTPIFKEHKKSTAREDYDMYVREILDIKIKE